jgi:hypothetical protein
MMYRQCTLLNHDARRKVAWIPSLFAFEGKLLTIQGESGWLVEEVGNEELSSQRIEVQYGASTRKAVLDCVPPGDTCNCTYGERCGALHVGW